MHRSISYKEQARLNQAACNALMARLDCQKATCEAAEKDLLQRYSQRGILEAANVDDLYDLNTVYIHQKPITQGRDIVDVSSCVSLRAVDEEQEEEKVILPGDEITDSDSEDETVDEVYNLRRERRHSKEVLHQKTQQEVAWKSLDKQVVEGNSFSLCTFTYCKVFTGGILSCTFNTEASSGARPVRIVEFSLSPLGLFK